MLKLKKANSNDSGKIHIMQVQSFQSLFTKYNDINTNPAVEPIERIIQKMNQDFFDYYFIQNENKTIGAIRVVSIEENICRILLGLQPPNCKQSVRYVAVKSQG